MIMSPIQLMKKIFIDIASHSEPVTIYNGTSEQGIATLIGDNLSFLL